MNDKMNRIAGPGDRVTVMRCATAGSSIRVIWAEKTSFALILAEAALIASLWFIAFLAAGRAGANHVFASIGVWRVEQGFLAILPLWLSFRLMDFIAGGSTRRLFYRRFTKARP
jgi:hypothetical protein